MPADSDRRDFLRLAGAGVVFAFLCDVFCGDGHEGMNGHLVVSA